MSLKYPSVATPQKDLESMWRTVQDLRLGYQALIGVPKNSGLEVANKEEVSKQIDGINKKLDQSVESGTWTPAYGATTTAPTATYAKQIGNYTRINDLVYISADIQTSGVSNIGSGQITLTGLPFDQFDYGPDWTSTFNIAYWDNWLNLSAYYQPSLMWRGNQTFMRVYMYRAATLSGNATVVNTTTFLTTGTSNRIIFSGIYRAAI